MFFNKNKFLKYWDFNKNLIISIFIKTAQRLSFTYIFNA